MNEEMIKNIRSLMYFIAIISGIINLSFALITAIRNIEFFGKIIRESSIPLYQKFIHIEFFRILNDYYKEGSLTLVSGSLILIIYFYLRKSNVEDKKVIWILLLGVFSWFLYPLLLFIALTGS